LRRAFPLIAALLMLGTAPLSKIVQIDVAHAAAVRGRNANRQRFAVFTRRAA
jgi:hypothetical protein